MASELALRTSTDKAIFEVNRYFVNTRKLYQIISLNKTPITMKSEDMKCIPLN